jgi:hypothetical protein
LKDPQLIGQVSVFEDVTHLWAYFFDSDPENFALKADHRELILEESDQHQLGISAESYKRFKALFFC